MCKCADTKYYDKISKKCSMYCLSKQKSSNPVTINLKFLKKLTPICISLLNEYIIIFKIQKRITLTPVHQVTSVITIYNVLLLLMVHKFVHVIVENIGVLMYKHAVSINYN